MSALFAYPKAAQFGRVVAKSKVYGHAGVSARIRQLFVEQVDQIVWQYKLAPETINLPATKSISEIQVFGVSLRTAELSDDVLAAIDRAIPFPIIFELSRTGQRKAIAAFKRPSEADSAKWVISGYFSSDWEAEDKSRQPLPTALNLSGLYDRLLSALMPTGLHAAEPLEARVARLEEIWAKERDIARIKARLAREKQFNKRVAINAELRQATQELNSLGGSLRANVKGGD